MKDAEKLMNLGLTDGEAKVYLSMVELGPSTVGPLSQKSTVAYSNIYGVLDRLIKKGLASIIIKEKTKYFQAASPIHLKDYLNKKQQEIESQKDSLKELIPRIDLLQNSKATQDAEIFNGMKGLRSAYERFFSNVSKKLDYRFFYIFDKETGEQSDLFYFSVVNLFQENKPNARGISNEYGRNSESNKILVKKKLVDCRFVKFPIPGNIEVYGERVLIISWGKEPTAIIINSKSISRSLSKYFDSVWEVAKR